MEGENDDVHIWHLLSVTTPNTFLRGLTIRRIVKYGQTPFSCPYFLTSSSVYTPAGIRFPGS